MCVVERRKGIFLTEQGDYESICMTAASRALLKNSKLQVMIWTDQEKLVDSFSGKGSKHFPLTVVPGVGSYRLELCCNGSGGWSSLCMLANSSFLFEES